MRHGGAEQRHDCVADVLIDRAAVPCHDLIGSGEIAVNQRMQAFIRQVARQSREAAEIGEQHRDRPPLRTVWGLRLRVRPRVVKPCDRFEQSTAMANGIDANITQVVSGELP